MASKNGSKQLFLGALLTAPLLVPAAALAEKDSGFYVGGAAGGSKFHDFSRVCNNVENAGATVADCRDKGFAWKAYGGYQFIRYFGVEVGYADFGKGRVRVTSPGAGDVDYKTRAVFADAVATAPLIGGLSFLAKVGVVRSNTKLNIDASTGLGLPSQTANRFGETYGIGFEYMFTDAFGMRAEYEIYNRIGKEETTGATHIHVMSVNGLLRF
jgi:OOP family OmpA-OmpF porin